MKEYKNKCDCLIAILIMCMLSLSACATCTTYTDEPIEEKDNQAMEGHDWY